jgi:hypothetical protein
MRASRGFVVAVVGYFIAFMSANMNDILGALNVQVSIGAIVTAAVSAGLLALDKWVRDFSK